MQSFVKFNKGPSEKENRAVQSTREIISQAPMTKPDSKGDSTMTKTMGTSHTS